MDMGDMRALGAALALAAVMAGGAASAGERGATSWAGAPAPLALSGFAPEGATAFPDASYEPLWIGATGDVSKAERAAPGLPVDEAGAVDWALATDIFAAERRVRARAGRARGLVASGFDISVSGWTAESRRIRQSRRNDDLR